MTYEEAISYIHAVSWRGSRPGLSRITELCHRLGDPQDSLRFVHVTGTNGKGSTCTMLASILRESGYTVGLFTSPYVRVFNERMQVMGELIPNETLAELVEEVRAEADAMADPPTEFELITAVGFVWFLRCRCDVVVLEAGMGGRLDSTNVIRDPLCCVITGVALDHMAILGDTVAAIAAEKAGIFKKDAPVVTGAADPDALAVLREKAAALGLPMTVTDRAAIDVRSADLSGTDFYYRGAGPYHICLLGLYQPQNAACVLDTVEALRTRGLRIPPEAVRRGLDSARWPARFELLSRDPAVIYDGGHNEEGAAACANAVRTYFGGRVCLLCGVMADKSYDAMIRLLAPLAETVFTVTPSNPRSLPARSFAGAWRGAGVPARACDSVPEGLDAALSYAREHRIPLLVTGSLYLYEAFRAAWDAGEDRDTKEDDAALC